MALHYMCTRCMVMDTVDPYRSAGLPRLDGWKVIPSKTSPSRSGDECLLGSIF
jgi:hypothetical protein